MHAGVAAPPDNGETPVTPGEPSVPPTAVILSTVPGSTSLQSNSGFAIGAVCPSLAALGDGATDDQANLATTCTALIETAAGGATDLGITDEQLNGALQNVAGEEVITQGTIATEVGNVQVANVGTRIAQIRGAGTVAGFQEHGNGRATFAVNLLGPESVLRGAGAGDGDLGGQRFGLFFNGTGSTGDKDETDREDGFDFDTFGVTGGLDYRFSDNLVLGVAAGFSTLDVDFDNTSTVAGGSLDSVSRTVTAYGTYYQGGLYVDGIVSYTKTDFDSERRVVVPSNNPAVPALNLTADANPDAHQFSIGLGGGYQLTRGALSFGPFGRATYTDIDIDDYRERNAAGLDLAVEDQNIDSFKTALGLQAAYNVSSGFGVFSPQIRAEWVHEFDDDGRSIDARYVAEPANNPNAGFSILSADSDRPDRDYFVVGLGVSSVLKDGAKLFVEYETVLGFRDIDEHIFTGGVRFEF